MINPHHLIESRIQIHFAVQFMAAAGRAFGQPQPDSSEAALDWHSELNLFIGQPISTDLPFRLAVDPISLTSLILDTQHQAIAQLSLIGETMQTTLDWHKTQLERWDLSVEKFATFISYPADLSAHSLANSGTFDAGDETARKALVAYFAGTWPVLQNIFLTRSGASPARVWPHHFDMATLINLNGEGETTPTIGVGLSPGDGSYDQPYWYVTPWPYPESNTLPELCLGSWHTEAWVGAILRADEDEIGYPITHEAQQTIKTFVDQAITACRDLLMPCTSKESYET